MSDQYDEEERRLAEVLRRATPDPPDGVARAEAARRYARRARRTKGLLAVGAAAAVVAAIVVVPTVLTSGSGSDQATGPTKSQPNPQAVYPFICPPAAQAGGRGHQPADGLVPPGAGLARLCPSEPNVDHWVAPLQALTTGVDRLASFVNGLPKTKPMPCPGPMRMPQYTLTFQYTDGRLVSVTGQVGSCDLVLAGVLRRGATPLLRDYLALLDEQRLHQAPPTPVMRAPGCPAKVPLGVGADGTTVVADHSDLEFVGGVACFYSAASSLTRSAPLSATQLKRLAADLAERATHRRPTARYQACERLHRIVTSRVIAVRDAWGDVVDLSTECAVYEIIDRNGTWYWMASPSTQRMLNRALHIVEPSLPMARLSGRLLAAGGPAGTTSRPLAGSVRLTGADGIVRTLKVGSSGRFRVDLPVGRYRIAGYSPAYMDGTAACLPEHRFVNVGGSRPTVVDVYCQEK